jgi:HlyD family secretion protein
MATKRSTSGLGWLLILVLLLGGGAYWWFQREGKAKPMEFRSAKVTKGDITQAVTASGQVNPLLNVQVGSQVSGIIQKLHADFNSQVTNGQLLAELDPSTFRATVDQSRGNLSNAVASLSLARVNARRAQELIAKSLISESDYDKTKADLELAEAQVAIRRAQLQKDEVDLSRASIYSPIDGVVISRNMDIGQTLAASFNAPVLFQIANDLHEMQIHAAVSEADIGGVEEGQDVNFTVDAFPTRTFRGTVSQVRYSATTNQNVVTYDTVIGVKNSDLKLRPGMTANVSIITARQRDVLKIPNAALRFRAPEGAPMKPVEKPATTSGTNALAASAPKPSDEGPVNLDEIPEQFRDRVLARFDKNGDGKIDGAEAEAYREDRRKRFGNGGGGQGRGNRGGTPGAPQTRTLYLVETTEELGGTKSQRLIPVEVRLGITDGTSTEIKSGLKEGDEVATGLLTPLPAAAPGGAPSSGPVNPFAPPRPGGAPTRRSNPHPGPERHERHHRTPERPQGLHQRRPQGARRPRGFAPGATRGVHRRDGGKRLGKVHPHEHSRLPRPADGGRLHPRRRGCLPAQPG